ncbi:MAG: HD domain-containing protein [Alphaproteobacteria bacterium]|nr:HD domain-containing protein [Alphaproteobacteria bacterium]
MQTDYENKISRQEALKLACYYLQERVRNGSHLKIIFEHAVHVFNVAKIAESIAKNSDGRLNPDTAYCLGLLHDIGRIKDETVTKVPHGIEGFNYLAEHGYPDLAPICLTHGFISKDIQKSDYPTYRPKLFKRVKEYLSELEYNDYDRIVQLADLFSRGKQIMSIHDRLEKNKSFYHIKNLSYEKQAYDLRDYINGKYGIDTEQLVQNIFRQPVNVYPTAELQNRPKLQPFKFYRFDGRFA